MLLKVKYVMQNRDLQYCCINFKYTNISYIEILNFCKSLLSAHIHKNSPRNGRINPGSNHVQFSIVIPH